MSELDNAETKWDQIELLPVRFGILADIRPDDTVVLLADTLLSEKTCERLKAYIRSVIPSTGKIMVLDGGMQIGVIRAAR